MPVGDWQVQMRKIFKVVCQLQTEIGLETFAAVTANIPAIPKHLSIDVSSQTTSQDEVEAIMNLLFQQIQSGREVPMVFVRKKIEFLGPN